MTYSETTSYLYNIAPSFQNVGKGAYKEGLSNTLTLDEHFGHPHHKYRTIHVAGTNGKGSCSHTIAAILQHSGLRVGLYTSPHILDFRERIRVNGEMIPENRVIRFVEEERAFFEPLHPSFFELTTALALKYFEEQEVDVAVIEVGLGGRLDCTNIINPELSIITNISFDHTQFLGDTLPEIAKEKAGVIKPNTPVVIGETEGNKDVRNVFLEKARQENAPIVFADEQEEVISSHETSSFGRSYTTRHGEFDGELGGICQEKNTATILTAVDILIKNGFKISTEDIYAGFSNVCKTTGLMGRWQCIGSNPTTICDTGHNPGGLRYIAQQLKNIKYNKLHIVIGMVSDKDIKHSLALLPKDAQYYFTNASVKRSLPAEKLKNIAQTENLRGNTYPTVQEAFEAAQSNCSLNDLIYIGGSTYVVADILQSQNKI